MKTAEYARMSLQESVNLLDSIVADLNDDQYNLDPQGTANSAAKNHVHIVSSIDFFLNGIVGGGAPQWSTFAPASGLPGNPLEIWGHGGRISREATLAYSKDVTAAALDVVSKLSDGDFDREIDTRFFGMKPIAYVVQLAALHTNGHAGDIAAVKGIQGLKGLPF